MCLTRSDGFITLTRIHSVNDLLRWSDPAAARVGLTRPEPAGFPSPGSLGRQNRAHGPEWTSGPEDRNPSPEN